MSPTNKKRQVDFQVISRWVSEGDRVLDLGCGRGVLLEYLQQTKSVYAVGVDIDVDRIISCIKRGVPAYHGDVRTLLGSFEDNSFDRVIFSRSVELLDDPHATLSEALRVGKHLTVGFVNHGFWKNRLSYVQNGRRPENEVYPRAWHETIPNNPFSIAEFEAFCAEKQIQIKDRVTLGGNWRDECKFWPNLMSGYALYDLSN